MRLFRFSWLFSNAGTVVINEINQAGASGFDVAKARFNLKRVAPKAAVLELAHETGDGMDAWYAFLDELAKANGK